jgi:hypothetical protein
MFWKKKSKPELSDYLLFYITEGDLKVEFGYNDINVFTMLAKSMLTGKLRNQCIDVIYNKMTEAGLMGDASYFRSTLQKKMKPSEYV